MPENTICILLQECSSRTEEGKAIEFGEVGKGVQSKVRREGLLAGWKPPVRKDRNLSMPEDPTHSIRARAAIR